MATKLTNGMDKVQLRQELRRLIAQISPAERLVKSKAICSHIRQSGPFQKGSTVMFFLSLPNEVDTTALILAAWQQGKTVAVPQMFWEQRHMIPVEITSLETGLKKDRMGLRNPVAGVPVLLEDIDLVVTPGLGFDRQGNRIGRGAAYYDRFFTTPGVRATRWGVCFSEQLCPAVPHGPQDVLMDAVVTEQGIIHCSPE